MSTFILPAGFRTTPKKPRLQRNAHPEQDLQIQVADMLSWMLREEDGVFWTGIDHSRHGKIRGFILKRMGVKPGLPDIWILYARRLHLIELKAGTGLSPAQKAVHRSIVVAGSTVAVCKSVAEVKMILDVWGIPTHGKLSAEAFRS